MSKDAFKKGLEGLDAGAAGAAGEEPERPAGPVELPPHPTVDAMRDRFGAATLRHEVVAGNEHIVYIPPERILEILTWLRDDPEQRFDLLRDVTAVDYGGGRPLQLVYEFWSIPFARQLRVKAELPGVFTTLGVSNVSFGLKPAARHVLNSVFLHECTQAGLDSAIVHAARIMPLARIPEEQKEVCLDLIYDRRRAADGDEAMYDPLQTLLQLFEGVEAAGTRDGSAEPPLIRQVQLLR